MSGVPGGDVTLHAAITAELALHRVAHGVCYCGWRWVFVGQSQTAAQEAAAHQAQRVMAVLADRLPNTPPDQLAGLIGGTVERADKQDGSAFVLARLAHTTPAAEMGVPFQVVARLVGPWVPDSPPAGRDRGPCDRCGHGFLHHLPGCIECTCTRFKPSPGWPGQETRP